MARSLHQISLEVGAVASLLFDEDMDYSGEKPKYVLRAGEPGELILLKFSSEDMKTATLVGRCCGPNWEAEGLVERAVDEAVKRFIQSNTEP